MHILIVEDDHLIAENLYDFLESCNVSTSYIVSFHSVTFCSVI